jgi:hypothetical protein
MIEHLMCSSLSGDHQGCAAGFIRLHVRGLRSHQQLIARVVVCATGAVHTDIFRSIRYLPNPVPSSHRLLAFEQERVTFRWNDYAHGGKQGQMTLVATEFLRRFFLHVLPKGSYASATSASWLIACVSLAWHCADNCWLPASLHLQKPEPVKAPPRVLPFDTVRVAARP